MSVKAKAPQRAATPVRPETSKADVVLKKLRLARGVTVAQIMEITGWQAHSVRSFLSAVVRKKLGLDLTSEVGRDGIRRYRVADGGDGGSRGIHATVRNGNGNDDNRGAGELG